MKILHTGDWHLGKKLDKYSRLAEQREVLNEICDIADAEAIDCVIITGDLFDTYNPPVEAVELFYRTLKKLACNGKRAVIAIAGNHDSPDRIEAPDPLARECGILFAGYPESMVHECELETGLKVLRSERGFMELKLPGCEYPLRLLLTPYANEKRLKTFLGIDDDAETLLRNHLHEHWEQLAHKYCDDNGVNLLAAHLYVMEKDGEQIPEPDDEKPILYIGGAQAVFTENIPATIQYTALGHLHRKQRIGEKPVYYSGSPLSYSFSEAFQDKYVMVGEFLPGKEVVVKDIKLTSGKKLIRKKADSITDAVSFLEENQDAYLELTVVSDTYLNAVDRKALHDAHDYIVSVIPEVTHKEREQEMGKQIDLSRNINELFASYFEYKNGQEPSSGIVSLFKEVVSMEEQ